MTAKTLSPATTRDLSIKARVVVFVNRWVRFPAGGYLWLAANAIDRGPGLRPVVSIVPVWADKEPPYLGDHAEPIYLVEGPLVAGADPENKFRLLLRAERVLIPEWAPSITMQEEGSWRAAVGENRLFGEAVLLAKLRKGRGLFLGEDPKTPGVRFVVQAPPSSRLRDSVRLKGRVTEVRGRKGRYTVLRER